MSVPANVRVNVLAPFPARVVGAAGITITKSNGIWTIALDEDALASIVDTFFASVKQCALEFVIDGGGQPITAAERIDLELPFACTATRWTMIADQVGSAVVDFWKATYAAAPPTVANSITGAAPATLSAARKAQSSSLTGWTTSFAQGDIVSAYVNSASGILRLTTSLAVTRT